MAKTKPTKQPLLIDCQVFQSASWHRGMGKYSKAFLGAICNDAHITDRRQLYFLFNQNLDTNSEVTDFIKAQYPEAELLYADLSTPKEPRNEHSIQPVIAANKAVLGDLLATKFAGQEVAFLILALYLDEVCSAFPDSAADKLVIYYDSIPYLYHERYSQFAGFFEHFYMPHTATVYEATKLLTISKTVANDLHLMFGLPEDVIFDIDGASVPRDSEAASQPDLDVKPDSFILMPTGQELRKNNTRAIRAFEQFRVASGSQSKLVITSYFTDEARAELEAMSDHIIFSGNVSEGEMLWLFQNCRFVFFASEYEGLGLPILEAVEQAKPVACSDISVFREMSRSAFHYFDPLNVDSIAETLAALDEKAGSDRGAKQDYDKILEHYTWANTAQLFKQALDAPAFDIRKNKPKIAIFCPDPAGFSAIGKVVTEAHAWYARYFDITYYFDKGPNHETIRPDLLSYLAPSFSVESFTADDYDRYDAVVYHIGNSEYHLEIIHTALAFPGYVILHDTYLSGAYANLGELGYMSHKRLMLEIRLDQLLPDHNTQGLPKSANLTSIVNNQLGIVTHSDYAHDVVKQKLLDKKVPVRKINLPVDAPMFDHIVHNTERRINIAFAGIIAKVKGTDIIENIAVSEEFADCNISIFGYSAVEPERLDKLRALPHVRIVTNPNDHEFQNLMANTDILVNVRMAYKGETSLTTLEAMRYGVAALVRDFGWYSELPDETVAKVEHTDEAVQVMREVVQDPDRRRRIRVKALEYIRQHHQQQAYAAGMYEIIAAGKPGRKPAS